MAQEREHIQQPSDTPGYIEDIERRPPEGWEDPQIKIVRVMVEQSGLLPSMIARNPGLTERVTDFFVGEKSILVIGGESGMGKSLIAADLRNIYADLGHVLPENVRKSLAVISWDRTHAAFFEEVSTAAGETIPLPKGETHEDGRKIVSGVLGDQLTFLRKYVDPDMRILVETPLIDTRGETIFDELGRYRGQVQTLIMHSPATREEILQRGRLMETSGQPDSMRAIREKLIWRILGSLTHPLSIEEQDEVIKRWWGEQLQQWEGMVVEWDPNDNRDGYNNSVEVFKSAGIRPDHLAPRSLSYATRNQLESIFRAIPDIDAFLRKIAP